jgi:hypothetical protein
VQVEDVEFLGQTFAWGAEQMKTLGILLTMLGWVQAAAAFNADDYRGGWETYGNDGALHIYEFSIRADRVRGVYCTDCSDATTLAFVDGKVETDGISFLVTHVKDDGSTAYQEHATAKYENGQLLVAGTRDGTGGGAFRWTMRKDPRGPAPVAQTRRRAPLNRGAYRSRIPRPVHGSRCRMQRSSVYGWASALASTSSFSSSAKSETRCAAWPAGVATTPTRWGRSMIFIFKATR